MADDDLPRPTATFGIGGDLLLRLLAVAAWVAAFDLALTHHFGLGIDNLPTLIGAPVIGFALTVLTERLLDDGERKAIRQAFRVRLRRWLKWPVIGAAYMLLGALGANVSSLQVVAPPGADHWCAQVIPAASRAQQIACADCATPAQGCNPPLSANATFLSTHWINPFGTPVTVSVSGYLPRTVRLTPFVGTLLVPEEDLTPTPSVLLRPPVAAYLAAQARLDVYVVAAAGLQLVAQADGVATWLIGAQAVDVASQMPAWQLELAAAQHEPGVVARMLRRWRNPRPLPLQGVQALVPGDRLCAVIVNVDGAAIAAASVVLARSAANDIPLTDLNNDEPLDRSDIRAVCTQPAGPG